MRIVCRSRAGAPVPSMTRALVSATTGASTVTYARVASDNCGRCAMATIELIARSAANERVRLERTATSAQTFGPWLPFRAALPVAAAESHADKDKRRGLRHRNHRNRGDERWQRRRALRRYERWTRRWYERRNLGHNLRRGRSVSAIA